jgi:flavin reductase (DIM6/NTAB) family NADH-FMN oxidoreductase RutF
MPVHQQREAIDADEYRNVIGHFASGVTVITTADRGARFGTTASAVTSLSLEPPTLLVCLNQTSSTGQAIERSGCFVVNILTEAQQRLARRFATKDPDKFTGVAVAEGLDGQPVLADTLAHLECRVTDIVASGTHVIFIACVDRAVAQGGEPLAYFCGRFGRLELCD